MPSPDAMPAYVGNPLAGDPIWEASSASELRIAITTKQVSRAGHPSDLLVAKCRWLAPLNLDAHHLSRAGAVAADLDLGNIAEGRAQLDDAQLLVKSAADPAINAASLEQRARLTLAEGGRKEARSPLRTAERVRAQARRPRGSLTAADVQTIAVAGIESRGL